MNSKRKLLISMLAIVFVLLAVVATVAIAFALTQQTITTTLNIGYVVEDIDGTASATYTIGGVTESLTAKKGNQVIGDTLVFHAGDTEDAGNLMFPEGQIPLSAQNDNIVIQYTYSNTGAKHYIASMSFDSELVADNMKVEYSIDGTSYSENRYAVVVPANTSNKSYWIKISIENKAKSASFIGDFKWLLSGCDEQEDSYLSLTSVEFQQATDWEGNAVVGSYQVSLANTGSYVGELVFPRSVNNDPVTTIAQNTSLTQEQKNQVTSVYIPDIVETIGDWAFYEFQNLQTVTFEQNETASSASVQGGTGLKSIGSDAFSGCTGLTSIELPSSLTSIDLSAFYGCTGLTSIQVANGNTKYHSAGNCLIETASKTLLLGYKTSVIPTDGSVTSIGSSAFLVCTGLTSITIPASVTSIGSYAFSGCTGLTSITIPSGVTSIGMNAFSNCTCLRELIIPNTVTSIDMSVLSGCTGLTSIEVASGNITYHSVGNCLIETASKILIAGCKTSVIPTDSSVTTIDGGAFYGVGLTHIWVPSNIVNVPDSVPPVFGGSITVYCEAESTPSGWDISISEAYGAIFKYSYTYEEYLAEVNS